MEIEIVPAKVTEEIGRRLDIILMSMGSGATGATVQYLFATDVPGTNTGHIPRHAKVDGNIGAEEKRVQRLRIEAFKALQAGVSTNAYPDKKHTLSIKDGEFEKFLAQLP